MVQNHWVIELHPKKEQKDIFFPRLRERESTNRKEEASKDPNQHQHPRILEKHPMSQLVIEGDLINERVFLHFGVTEKQIIRASFADHFK